MIKQAGTTMQHHSMQHRSGRWSVASQTGRKALTDKKGGFDATASNRNALAQVHRKPASICCLQVRVMYKILLERQYRQGKQNGVGAVLDQSCLHYVLGSSIGNGIDRHWQDTAVHRPSCTSFAKPGANR